MMRSPRRLVATLVLCLALLGVAITFAPETRAAKSETWVRSGQTLRLGTFDGAIELPAGPLAAGPRSTELGRPDTALVWDLLLDDDLVLAATGEGGGLIAMTPDGGQRHVASLDVEPEVFAVAPAAAGVVYVATGPSGAVYRLDTEKKDALELYRPEAAYIWDLARLPDGTLLVATGLPARVLHVDPKKPGVGTVLWSSTETHVRCLAVGPGGRIVAGTVGSGWLVEIDRDGGGFVLHDSGRAEAVAAAFSDDGTLWAAFAGPVRKPKTATGTSKVTGSTPGSTTITVRPKNGDGNEDGDGGDNGQNKKEDAEKGSSTAQAQARAALQAQASRRGGEVVVIEPGEEARRVWSDSGATPMSLVDHPDGGVLVGTATPARVWWVRADGAAGLWHSIDDAQAVTSLARSRDAIVLGASNPALVKRFDADARGESSWTSDVMDAGVRARFGRVHAVVPPGAAGGVRVLVRAGNTLQPDEGWTPWRRLPGAAGPPTSSGAPAGLPLARFLQVRAELESGGSAPSAIERVEVRWRGLNRPPKIDRVEVLPPGVALRPVPPSSVTSGQVPVVGATVPKEAASELKETRSAWRSKSAFEPGARTLRWSAKDADDDGLTYDVEICLDEGKPCDEWQLLAAGLEREFWSFDSRARADGVYRFRVRALDAPGNYAEEVRMTTALSEPVVIDNSAPRIASATASRAEDGSIRLRVEARDPGGRLAGAEVTIDGARWVALAPEDGVADADSETFRGTIAAAEDGRTPALRGGADAATGAAPTVRVTDSAGNVTVTRVER